MKQNSIEWHEEQLQYLEENHELLRSARQRAEAAELRSHKEWAKYFRQIERAKRLGKKSFNRERFGEE